MADYGYTHIGSSISGKSRLGQRTWGSSNSTAEEGWSNPGAAGKTERHQEHECRPVIVGPDGTTKPGVLVLPQQHKMEGIAGKVEKAVECIYPSATAYANGYAANPEAHNKWSKRIGHYKDQTSKSNDFIDNVQTAVTGSGRTGTSGGLFQHRNPNSINGHGGSGRNGIGNDRWSRPSGGSYNIDTEGWSKPSSGMHDTRTIGWNRPSSDYNSGNDIWSRPSSGANVNGTNEWNRPGSGTSDTTNGWSKPSGGNNDIGTNGWGRPSGGTIGYSTNEWSGRQSFYDGSSFSKGISSLDDSQSPTTMTTDGWSRPSRVSWATPSYESTISKSHSDAGAAEYMMESARPSSINKMTPRLGRFSASSPTYPMKETTTETIDSREAQRRYGSASVLPPIINPKEATIDAREAARKYNNSFM